MLINKIFKTHPLLLTIGQDYSNGRPRSKSELLDGESRTTSTSQRSILYTEVFISKSTFLAVLPRQFHNCRSSYCLFSYIAAHTWAAHVIFWFKAIVSS